MNGWGLSGHVMEACALNRRQVKMLAFEYRRVLRKELSAKDMIVWASVLLLSVHKATILKDAAFH